MGKLSFRREPSANVLKDFQCGITEMDMFIYLAVSLACRNQNIGTEIILAITDLAHSQHTPFITVDAYVTPHYSAVPFYEKCGFTHLENQDRGYDTIRMLLNIIPPIDR